MTRPYLFLTAALLVVLMVSFTAEASGNFSQPSEGDPEFMPLNNRDILTMVERHIGTDVIIKAIRTSACTFDTFPPVLREMRRRGVPEAVLQAMVEAPYGPADNQGDELAEEPIYHYAEQLRQMGVLTPIASGRSSQRGTRQSRVRAARRRS